MALGNVVSGLFGGGSSTIKAKSTGVSTGFTNTYNPSSADTVLSLPSYQEHMVNIYNTRLSSNSKDMIMELATSDPDVSATINAYCTVANTKPLFLVRNYDGTLDPEGHVLLMQLWKNMTQQFDYSKGFQFRQALFQMLADWRNMLLRRGGIASELVFGKGMIPTEVRTIDLGTIRWIEPQPGVFLPRQTVSGASEDIDLNIPTFNCSFYRRNPTQIYTNSPFVSAINTIAARQAVINDLYRIMVVTGFPRISISVAEEVIAKSMPADIAANPKDRRDYLNARLADVMGAFSNIRADQAFVHMDSVSPKVINEKNPGAALDIQPAIKVLDNQNQAALKVVSSVLGRGESGVNTASVEARIFALNADEINYPIADMLSNISTMMLNSQGRPNYVEVQFKSAELRPELELENHLTMRQSRLAQDLSRGVISDDEYTLQMYYRHPLPGAPVLSGTGFMEPQPAGPTDPGGAPDSSPNAVDRSLTPPGAKQAKSKTIK